MNCPFVECVPHKRETKPYFYSRTGVPLESSLIDLSRIVMRKQIDNKLQAMVLCLKLISNYCVYISALLLLYDVTNKASFDKIRVSML